MGDGLALQMWRLLPIDPAAAADAWACSRFDGSCDVIARNERHARLLAAGAFCLPVAPEHCEAISPWLSPAHVLAELIDGAAAGPAGVVNPGAGLAALAAVEGG